MVWTEDTVAMCFPYSDRNMSMRRSPLDSATSSLAHLLRSVLECVESPNKVVEIISVGLVFFMTSLNEVDEDYSSGFCYRFRAMLTGEVVHWTTKGQLR
jgi:hypothetical protein